MLSPASNRRTHPTSDPEQFDPALRFESSAGGADKSKELGENDAAHLSHHASCFPDAAGGLAVTAAAGRGYAQSRTIELISYVTAPAPSVQAMRVFADKVAERAAGALVIDIEHKSGLSSPVLALSQISPLSHFMSVQARDVNPIFMLSSLPMVATSLNEAQVLLDVARPYYDAALARFDLALLAADPWRPPTLWSSKPLESARDIKGTRFDIQEMAYTAGWKAMFERLGARYSPFAAEFMVTWSFGTTRFEFTFQFFTEIFAATQLGLLTVSRTFLSGLPQAHREALVEASRLAEAEWWQAMRTIVICDQTEMAAMGVTVTSEPPRELVSALRTAASPTSSVGPTQLAAMAGRCWRATARPSGRSRFTRR